MALAQSEQINTLTRRINTTFQTGKIRKTKDGKRAAKLIEILAKTNSISKDCDNCHLEYEMYLFDLVEKSLVRRVYGVPVLSDFD